MFSTIIDVSPDPTGKNRTTTNHHKNAVFIEHYETTEERDKGKDFYRR